MRCTTVDVQYKGLSITDDIGGDVLSFSYTDNAEGEADEISLSIVNAGKKWLNDWMPQKTDLISATIKASGMGGSLACGTFLVDTVGLSGRPLTATIKALSIPVDTNFSEVNNNKTWDKGTLKDIASTIASNAGVPLKYEASYNPKLNFTSQLEQTDKHFLYELCAKNGLYMKLFSNQIVIYDPVTAEQAGTITTFSESDMLSWSCESTLTEAGYSGCKIQYTDPSSTKKLEYTHSLKGAAPKVFELTEQADNLAHAEQICKAKLRALNMSEMTIKFSVMGNSLLIAGLTIKINDFGVFTGKYFIDTVTHSVGGGYKTSVNAHMVTE